MCEVALPNREIRFVYQSEILNTLSNTIAQLLPSGFRNPSIPEMQLPGIIIELKAVKKASPEELKNLVGSYPAD